MCHSLKFFILVLALALSGCKSSDVKAERMRMEQLYALDNTKVAQAWEKAGYGGSAYAKEYLEIQRECAKEELKQKGKWCEKFSKVQLIHRGLVSESFRKGMQVPKF
jgi:hypothetical protein